MRLQVNSDISNKLAMWLSRDNVVNTFPIRGSGTVECTRRASLGDGEECVDEGKLVVTRKPQERGSVAVAQPGVPAVCPNYFTVLFSYTYTSSSISIYLSRYMPCLCVSPLSGFSSPTLRRPHLSSPPAYRICCLLTLVHLQSARFPRRCPEAGKNSTAPGLSLKPITTNAVCSLGHRQRPNPLSYCCVGGNLCR